MVMFLILSEIRARVDVLIVTLYEQNVALPMWSYIVQTLPQEPQSHASYQSPTWPLGELKFYVSRKYKL
jgi:hypothetical protein